MNSPPAGGGVPAQAGGVVGARGAHVTTPSASHPPLPEKKGGGAGAGLFFWAPTEKGERTRMNQGARHSSPITHHILAAALAIVSAVALAGCAWGYTRVREIKAAPEGF